MTRFKQPLVLTLAAVAVGALLWWALGPGPDSDGTYVYTTVERTDLRATVSSTGTLEATETVEVGTQVSGQVAAVYVDYNDVVEQGELLAVLDTDALDASLESALASVEQARASLRQAQASESQARAQVAQAQAQLTQAQATSADAQATLARNAPLADRGYLSQSEFQPLQTAVQTADATVGSQRAAVSSAQAQVRQAQAGVASAQAQVEQAQAQVAQARKNRANAEIRAPIGGIVVERAIDAGQTVAASFETPTLFVLAENLDQMQILADVDESDVGQVGTGQPVSFTVPAYPDEEFSGVVREVRLQPTTEQNVVTYTAVIDAENVDGQLLPGMTATVDFVTDEANGVLAVSMAALQVQPTPDMLAALSEPPAPPDGMPGPDSSAGRPEAGVVAAPSMLWYLDDAGQLAAVPVQTGLSAGTQTQVIPSESTRALVRPGFRVIEQVLAADDGDGEGGFGPPGGGPPGGGGPGGGGPPGA